MFHPKGPTFFELARQALSSTQRGYDLLAGKFDYTPFRTPDDILRPVARLIGTAGSVDSALDVCCGTGAAMEMLRPLCRERLVGLDMSQGMIEVGQQRLAKVPGPAVVQFVRGDALQIPFSSEFDVAVCFGALGHILPDDELLFLKQVHSALRPGGRFVFVSSPMPPFWSRRYLLSRGFNAAMHLRNLLVRPPFIMFYLTFLIPRCLDLAKQAGFTCHTHQGLYPQPLADLQVVVATRAAD